MQIQIIFENLALLGQICEKLICFVNDVLQISISINLEGRELRGVSDEKMRSMWLGRENEEYVARTRNFST